MHKCTKSGIIMPDMPTQTQEHIKRIVDFEPWVGASSTELGYEGEHLHIERHRYTDPENQQQFNITDIDARPNGEGPTVIYLTSHNYRIDELLERRMSIYATQTKSRVIICEMPGITMNRENPNRTKGAFQIPDQTSALLRGNWEPTSTAQLKAIDAVIGLEDGQEIQLLGESMSTHSVVGVLQSVAHGSFEKNLNFTKIDLIEPINTSGKLSLGKIADLVSSLNTVEAFRKLIYLEENKRINHEVAPYEQLHQKIVKRLNTRQLLATIATGLGVRVGIDTGLLELMENSSSTGLDLGSTRFTLITARESVVSSGKDARKLVQAINERGGHAQHVMMKARKGDVTPEGQPTPIGHAFGTSLGRQASQALIAYELAA